MKSIVKLFMLGVISAAVMTSVSAEVVCKAHHTAKGKVWVGKAATQAEASEKAMSECMHHAKHGKKCVIKLCKTVGEGHHEADGHHHNAACHHKHHEHHHEAAVEHDHEAGGHHEHHHEAGKHEQASMDWQCTSMNSHHERFVAMGVSSREAGEHAKEYCKAQSPFDTSCAMLGCVYKVRH